MNHALTVQVALALTASGYDVRRVGTIERLGSQRWDGRDISAWRFIDWDVAGVKWSEVPFKLRRIVANCIGESCGEGSEETCLGRLYLGTCQTPGCGRPAVAMFKKSVPGLQLDVALVRVDGTEVEGTRRTVDTSQPFQLEWPHPGGAVRIAYFAGDIVAWQAIDGLGADTIVLTHDGGPIFDEP